MRRFGKPTLGGVCARSQRAATLIELLVVMSMIGLLITMLIPSLKQSMDLAADTVCKHNLREIGHCLELYRTENDGWLPTAVRPKLEIEAVGERDPWFFKLYPTYLPDPMILTCPEDPFRYRMARAGATMLDPYVSEYASYGINRFIVSSGDGFVAQVDRHQPTKPHDTILVADLGPDSAVGGPKKIGSIVGPIRNASLLLWDDGFDPVTGERSRPWLTKRHRRGINVLTLAGGVREARTLDVMRDEISHYYHRCAVGGCTFCNELHVEHYSFARDHLYWWTGAAPSQ